MKKTTNFSSLKKNDADEFARIIEQSINQEKHWGKYYSKPTPDYPFNIENQQEDPVEKKFNEKQKDINSKYCFQIGFMFTNKNADEIWYLYLFSK